MRIRWRSKPRTVTRIACQARTLATWPDGSVKWLMIDFRHVWTQESVGRYRVVYGEPGAQGLLATKW